MSTIGQLISHLADTMWIWRDGAIAALACIVIACLWLYASAVSD